VRAFLASAALLALLATPALAARPEPRDLGLLPPPLRSDGERFATWSNGSVVRVVDTRERESFLVEVPGECRHFAVGGGQLLFSCPTSEAEPRCGPRHLPLLYSIRLRRFHWPAHVQTLLGYQGTSDGHGGCFSHHYSAIGRHWIGYQIQGKGTERFAFEWHDGRSVRQAAVESGRRVIDLHERDLVAPLCRPLNRTPDPGHGGGPYDDAPWLAYDIARPFALHYRSGIVASSRLYLERCGSSKRKLLSTSAYDYGLTRRVAYWSIGYRLHVLYPRSGRRIVYDFQHGRADPPEAFQRTMLDVADTTSRLYVTINPPGEAPRAYVVAVRRR
jgi:hypothetical protein